MNELVGRAASAPVAVTLPVHEAVRAQLVAEIGEARLTRLRDVLDDAAFAVTVRWLSGARRGAMSTKESYADDIAMFGEWAAALRGGGPLGMADVTAETIEVWGVFARSREWAVRTQRRVLSAVSSLWRYAALRGAALGNPVDHEEHMPRLGTSTNGRPPGATRVLRVDEVVAVREACGNAEERLVFDLLYLQGLRVSAVVGLMIEHFARERTPAAVRLRLKGGTWITRELGVGTAAALREHVGDRQEGAVLVDSAKGRGKNRHQVVDITRRLARHAGVDDANKVTPHVLRASAITHLLDGGMSLQEVQAWANHASAQTTQGYWERSKAVRRDAAMSGALAAGLDQAEAGLAEPCVQ